MIMEVMPAGPPLAAGEGWRAWAVRRLGRVRGG